MEGLVWFKPLEFTDANPGSPIIIDEVYFDGRKVDTTILEKTPSNLQSLKIEFGTAYWGNNSNLILEYKLEGYNKQWVELNPLQNFIEFSNLPSGKYKLFIRKRGGFGNENLFENPSLFHFVCASLASPFRRVNHGSDLAGLPP